MLIYSLVNSCDTTSDKYSEPTHGGAYLARGATGRWCEVIHIGPAELSRQQALGAMVLSREDAIKEIQAKPGVHTVDF